MGRCFAKNAPVFSQPETAEEQEAHAQGVAEAVAAVFAASGEARAPITRDVRKYGGENLVVRPAGRQLVEWAA